MKSLISNNEFNIKIIPLFNTLSKRKEGILIYSTGPDEVYDVDFSNKDSITFEDVMLSKKLMNKPPNYKNKCSGAFKLSYKDYMNVDFYNGKDLILHLISIPHVYYNSRYICENISSYYDYLKSGKRIMIKPINLFFTRSQIKKIILRF